ncbi:hypothetical protein GCM10027026_08520 [Myroides odoratimimus subsp. xuanwuensis]
MTTLAALVVAGCSNGPSFTRELVEHEKVAPQRVSLGDGTELAVGRDGEEFLAQWREAEGRKWTKPQTVVEGEGLEADEVTLQAAGTTAVVHTAWYVQNDDERDSHERLDAAVCRDFECKAVREDVVDEPMIAEDGEFAAVPTDRESLSFAIWRDGADDWEDVVLTGPPVGSGRLVYGAPHVVLLGNGSLATVVGRDGGDGCVFDLWLGEPHQTDLEVVASTTSREQAYCDAEWVEGDGDTLSFYNRPIDAHVTFALDEGKWVDDQPDAGGLLPIDSDDGFPMLPTDLDDESAVAIGSPDKRRIVAQHRPAGESTWSPPQTVAQAKPGQACQYSVHDTIYDHTDVMYLVLCWPEGSKSGGRYDDAPPPSTGIALASADGKKWAAKTLTKPAYGPQTQPSEALALASGRDQTVVWRAGATAFQIVNLPLPTPTYDGFAVIGDTAIRVTGNPDDSARCRPTWSVAPITASSWGPAQPMTPIPDWAEAPNDCYGVVMDEADTGRVERPGQTIRVAAVIEDLNGDIGGQLKRAGGQWRFSSTN